MMIFSARSLRLGSSAPSSLLLPPGRDPHAHWPNIARSLVAGLALLLAPACTVTIPPMSPRPNIALAPQHQSLRLVLSHGIEVRLAIQVGTITLVVEAWRAILADGFRHGFGGGFRLTTGADADLTLALDEVRLEFGNFEPAKARIQFKATVFRGGAVLRRSAGMAKKEGPMFAGFAVNTTSLLAKDVAGAIEAMYEQIAKDLSASAEATVLPASARCVPGQSSACIGPKRCHGYQVCSSEGLRYGACSCGD
jgi:hypothetical protein